jgi:hypothetical protein
VQIFNVLFHVNPVVHVGFVVNGHSNPDGVFSGTVLLLQPGIVLVTHELNDTL